jgi:hypothetical protein
VACHTIDSAGMLSQGGARRLEERGSSTASGPGTRSCATLRAGPPEDTFGGTSGVLCCTSRVFSAYEQTLLAKTSTRSALLYLGNQSGPSLISFVQSNISQAKLEAAGQVADLKALLTEAEHQLMLSKQNLQLKESTAQAQAQKLEQVSRCLLARSLENTQTCCLQYPLQSSEHSHWSHVVSHAVPVIAGKQLNQAALSIDSRFERSAHQASACHGRDPRQPPVTNQLHAGSNGSSGSSVASARAYGVSSKNVCSCDCNDLLQHGARWCFCKIGHSIDRPYVDVLV